MSSESPPSRPPPYVAEVHPGRRAGAAWVEDSERAGGNRARQHGFTANALEMKHSGARPDVGG